MIIGADPGKTGAIVLVDESGNLVDAIRIPYAKPVERAWLVGGKHSETKFTVPPIDVQQFAGWKRVFTYGSAPTYLEEPSMGGGKSKTRGGSSGVDASINRAFQGLLQVLASNGRLYTVGPKHWQSQLFRMVPRSIESTAWVELGIPGNNVQLNTKQRARLACIFQWGSAECVLKLRHTPKSKLLDSGRCDAACLALFGMLHQKLTPRLMSQPIASHLRDLGIK